MKDWVLLLTAIIQCLTATMIILNNRKEKQKGTKRRGPRKR